MEKKSNLSYAEKTARAAASGDPVYETLKEQQELPDSLVKLPLWYLKNYLKRLKASWKQILLWVIISTIVAFGLNLLFMKVLYPALQKTYWYVNEGFREGGEYAIPYIFGGDADTNWHQKFGPGYLRGFDEPWQFIYRTYDQWYDTGTYGGATRQRTTVGIFAAIFSYALVKLIGLIVAQIRFYGVKGFFKNLALVPKKVIDYSKRSSVKAFDHFLIGNVVAFIIGFFLKNPFAMPLIALLYLIDFSQGSDSEKAESHFITACVKKWKKENEAPLFADSALHVWGFGMGFLLYSLLGAWAWNGGFFHFYGRLIATLFFALIMVIIYVVRNGKKSARMAAEAAGALLIGFGVMALQTVVVSAKILGYFFDAAGRKVGVLLQFVNSPDAVTFGSEYGAGLNGVGAGAGGLGAGSSNSRKPKNTKTPEQQKKEEEQRKQQEEKRRKEEAEKLKKQEEQRKKEEAENLRKAQENSRDQARKIAREQGKTQFDETSEKEWKDMNSAEKVKKIDTIRAALTEEARNKGDINKEYDHIGNKYITDLQSDLDTLAVKAYTGTDTEEDHQRFNELTEKVNKYLRGDTDLQGVEDYNTAQQSATEKKEEKDDPLKDYGHVLDGVMKRGGDKGIEYLNDLLTAFEKNPELFVNDPAIKEQLSVGGKLMIGSDGVITFLRNYGNGDSVEQAAGKSIDIMIVNSILADSEAGAIDTAVSLHTLRENAKLDLYSAVTGQDVSAAKDQNNRIQDAVSISGNARNTISAYDDMKAEYIKMIQGQKNGLTTELLDDYRSGKYGENIRNMQLFVDQISDMQAGRDVFQEWYNGLEVTTESYEASQNRFRPTGSQSLDRR